MSDGMRRELMYLSSYATNRYFIPNWGKNEQIEITKDGTYAVTKENVKRSFRIKNMKWTDKSLLLTLDNGSVIQYDSIIWSTNDCSLVSTGKDGTRYVDDRTVWEGTADLLYWCNSWVYY